MPDTESCSSGKCSMATDGNGVGLYPDALIYREFSQARCRSVRLSREEIREELRAALSTFGPVVRSTFDLGFRFTSPAFADPRQPESAGRLG